METKYLGLFMGEEMYGNEVAERCMEYFKNEQTRLWEKNTEQELELFTSKK